jgi:DNA helicase-2/ATP-dependent DNA helicase PcrA
MYDAIFVDETQDLAGYDFDLLEALMRAGIPMEMVGDPRQGTFRTNESARNRRYCGSGFLDKAKEWEAAGLCAVEKQARSYRCNQRICDFADKLYPDFDKTSSLNDKVTGHDGVFMVASKHLDSYTRRYSPQFLRYNRTTDTHGHSAVNFGNAKGMTFARVLIVPHGPIKQYLLSGELSAVEGSLAKFYVAVTRARHSVAFLYDGKCCGGYPVWEPE